MVLAAYIKAGLLPPSAADGPYEEATAIPAAADRHGLDPWGRTTGDVHQLFSAASHYLEEVAWFHTLSCLLVDYLSRFRCITSQALSLFSLKSELV